MKLTIIREDGAVYKDGISYLRLDLTAVPSDIHALQWIDVEGWIEFKDGTPNEIITALPDWALSAEAAWEVANTPKPPVPPVPLTAEQEAAIAARQSALAKLTALGLTANEIKALVG